MRSFKPNLQQLETRQMMAGDVNFGHLADRLETRMLSLDSAVNAVQTATKLPVVGDMFAGNQEIVDLDGGVTREIADELRNLPRGAGAGTIQNELANRLMAIGYLGDHNGDGSVDRRDVQVTVDHSQSDISIETRLTKNAQATSPRALDFDIGLDSVPLKLTSTGDLNLQVGIDYQNFSFGLDNGVFEFDTSKSEELKIHVLAGLNNNAMQGRIGFLEFSASQQDEPGARPTQLDATMNIDVKPAGIDWSIDAVADVHLDLYAGIAGMSQTAPSLGADFDFHWDFKNLDATNGLQGVTAAPSMELNNVRLKLGQVLSDVVRPWLSEVQKVTAPLQPIVDILNSPIPGLSDLSNLVGQGDITLIDLATAWGDYTTGDGVQWPDRHTAMQQESVSLLRTAITITEVIDAINSLSVDAKNMEIVLGSYQILGNGSDDIRNSTAAVVETTTQAIGSKLGIRELEEFDVAETLNNMVNEHGDAAQELSDAAVSINADYDIQTPMFTAKPWVMMLLGQESDLIRFDADLQIDIDQRIPFVNFFGLGVGLDAELDFDAQLGIGFDTRGFLDASLLEGFYIDTDSMVEFSGGASLYAGLDVGVASATVNGGISTGGGKVRLEFGDPNIDGKLRPREIASLSASQLFVTSGHIDVDASLRAEIGVDTPFGFVGVSKDYVFAKHTILDLNRDIQNGNPWSPPANPNLASLDTSNGTLTLNIGDTHAANRNVGVGEKNEAIRIEQIAGTGNGATILVHGFGATDIFDNVQRIVADAGSGNDRIQIDSTVMTPVSIQGGAGDDLIVSHGSGLTHLHGNEGNDRIEASKASSWLYGNEGDDYLRSGSGLHNSADGGTGSDTLFGGSGNSFLYGSEGNDKLFGGSGHTRFYGGRGDDVIELSSGDSDVFAGAGDNRVLWDVTDGNAWVDAVGNTVVEVVGTSLDDEIFVNGTPPQESYHHVGTIHVDVPVTGRSLQVGLMHSGRETEEELAMAWGKGVQTHLSIETGQGSDLIEVGYMGGSGLTSFAANVSQVIQPDGAEDQIRFQGSVSNDRITVDQQEYFAYVKEDTSDPEGGLLYGPSITGGLMSVEGLHDFRAIVGNDGDHLQIELGDGHDWVDVLGTTGKTTLVGSAGIDQLNVHAGEVTDLLGEIDFRGGSGSNVVRLNMTGLHEEVELEVSDSELVGAMISRDQFGVATRYPLDIGFSNDGGSLRYADVRTGNNADEITLGENLSGSLLRVNGGNGDDTIRVESGMFGSVRTDGYLVYGGSGNNTLEAARGPNDWRVHGTRDVDLNGTPFHHIDHLIGSNGQDRFRFDDGVDFRGTLNGGAGVNTLDYSAWTSDVVVNLMWGEASNVNTNQVRGVLNVQNFVGGHGNDLFVGNSVANDASGGAGRDVLIGGLGADTLDGGGGEDLLIGERFMQDRNRAQLQTLAQTWASTADPGAVGHLVDAVFMLDDGEIDSLTQDPVDLLF